MMFWPYHCVEEEETSTLVKTVQHLDVENGRTHHYAPARHLPTSADAPHASSSLRWADSTWKPDDQTRVTDLDEDDVNMT